MSIIRVEKNSNYTVMNNCHLRENKMSLKAIGLMSKMLSLPEDWDYSVAGLVAICKENDTAIQSALDELKEFGYLQVVKKMPNETKSGRIEYEYVLYEQKQGKEKQGVENLGLEFLGVDNQEQLNTNIINNNKQNNKTNNKENITKEIVDYLNERLGTKYKSTTRTTSSSINARIKEGYTLEDFKLVIDKKYKEWKGTQWEKYLTPETLFRPSNFEKYLNQKIIKDSKQQTDFQTRDYTKEEFDKLYDSLDDLEI